MAMRCSAAYGAGDDMLAGDDESERERRRAERRWRSVREAVLCECSRKWIKSDDKGNDNDDETTGASFPLTLACKDCRNASRQESRTASRKPQSLASQTACRLSNPSNLCTSSTSPSSPALRAETTCHTGEEQRVAFVDITPPAHRVPLAPLYPHLPSSHPSRVTHACARLVLLGVNGLLAELEVVVGAERVLLGRDVGRRRARRGGVGHRGRAVRRGGARAVSRWSTRCSCRREGRRRVGSGKGVRARRARGTGDEVGRGMEAVSACSQVVHSANAILRISSTELASTASSNHLQHREHLTEPTREIPHPRSHAAS